MQRRAVVVVGITVAVTLAACSSSDSSSSSTTSSTSTAPATAAPAAWKPIDRAIAAMGPDVGFLAARVTPSGTCEPVHAVAASTARPTASQFKLFVLGALGNAIRARQISWQQGVTVADADRSVGNSKESGSLQFAATGASVPVEEAATKMISISDNTAADILIELVGRTAVERQVRRWSEHAAANTPFPTTREMILLHYVAGLGDRYLATPQKDRAAFLASSVDPVPLAQLATGYSADPRYIDDIEWFASPDDICRAFAGLQQLSEQKVLAPIAKVMSREDAGIGLDRSAWRTVWYKGGSEPGVLTLGWLATNRSGSTYVVEAMVSNPDAALSADSITDLVAVGRRAFGVLER
jgi:beta-lactamase class A